MAEHNNIRVETEFIDVKVYGHSSLNNLPSVNLRLNPTFKMGRLMRVYADLVKLDDVHHRSLFFFFKGHCINDEDIPEGLGMKTDDEVEVHLENSESVGQQVPNYIKLQVFSGSSYNYFFLHFMLKPTTKLGKMMMIYAAFNRTRLSSIRFLYNGRRLNENDTADKLGLQNDDEIEVYEEQCAGSEISLNQMYAMLYRRC